MTIQTVFTNWQARSPINASCSPNLTLIREWLMSRFGGQHLGCYADRPIRAGTSPSSHAHGAAFDWRYEQPGPGRQVLEDTIIPELIYVSKELGIQAIHDYKACRIWRAMRTPNTGDAFTTWWKVQTPDGTMGQSWAGYLHIETNAAQWGVSVPIDMRLGKPVEQQALKPVLKLGATGDYVRWVQQRLYNNGYTFIKVDGRFGEQTLSAVRWLQGANGLPVTGEVDTKTWALIDALPS